MNIDLQKKYLFNKAYCLCNDVHRVMLVSNQNADKIFNLFIHPIHAIFLSLFDGSKALNDNLKTISTLFGLSKDDALEIVRPFLENLEDFKLSYDGETFYFPTKMLVENIGNEVRGDIRPEKFIIAPPYDFKSVRANSPRRILLVLNLTCMTDCFYCYAHKQHPYAPMSTERICKIIEEARDNDVVSFELSGGEVLLHSDWEKILKKFVECGYKPDISTKVPVKEDVVAKLKTIGINNIQISLDTLDEELLAETLKVGSSYAEKIRETILAFDCAGFDIVLKSTLTKKTCNLTNVQQLLEFASGLKHIKKYTCSTVGYSQFKGISAFKEMIPTVAAVKELEIFLSNVSSQYEFDILDDLSAATRSSMNDYKKFKKRSICSGNLTTMTIMPDGKVTLCEELYWNENFILGDLTESSISEVWKSPKAKTLSCIQRDTIPDASPCKKCRDFEKCRHDRGVCWKDVIAVYGGDNWLYPDPTCPFAPPMINDVYYE